MTPCGTVGYTAPEIVKDERYSKSVDMWALGCVLYTLLCGFPPFYDESIHTLTEKVANGTFTFLKPWWDEISDSCVYSVPRRKVDLYNNVSNSEGSDTKPAMR
jgi:serine/threonine protein kinase